MMVPSPAELQWRIDHLAGNVRPPPVEPVDAALRKVLPCPSAPPMFPGLVREYLERQAQQARDVALEHVPSRTGRLSASIVVRACGPDRVVVEVPPMRPG